MRALVIILSVHLFSVQTKLLYWLNPETTQELKHSFSFLTFDEPSILAMIFALSYSIATAVVIYNTENKRAIIVYAIMDAFGVMFYYFTKIPIVWVSIYFALYTFILIGSIITINSAKPKKEKPIAVQMAEMAKEGMNYQQIAEEFNTSTATVSRKINSLKK